MSISIASTLVFISQQFILYTGIPLLILGILGGLFNIIVFLSLKTFRENSCAFYLIIMSFVNIGQLITGLLSRIIITMTGIDWTLNSVFYCKFRWYFVHICALTSFTCICLATIDQFLATSSNFRFQQYSQNRYSRYLCIIFIIIWSFYEIPSLIFYDLIISSTTARISCAMTNSIYQKYNTYGYILILTGILPILITVVFGLLAYRNVRQIPYRAVPFVRRELDKQLTTMVLVQVIFNFCDIAPFTTVTIYMHTVGTNNDPIIAAQLQLILAIATCLYYSYFSCPFYIYISTSKRFRQQFIHVIFRKYFNRTHQVDVLRN